MKRLTGCLLIAVVAAFVAGEACAQERKDTVRFTNKSAVSGRVLRDTWETVEVDRNGDGAPDKAYPGESVERVDYANPLYVLQGQLRLSKPAGLIRWYTVTHNVYEDTDLPKHVRQQVYYDVANAYVALARGGDAGMLPKAAAAFERLFREVPDTRYAVRGRKELGSLYLEMGKSREAVREFEVLASGKYGAKVAQLSKLLVARVELTLRRWQRAERLLSDLSKSGAVAKGEPAQEVALLRSRALVGQKKLPEAYAGIDTVLAGNPSRRILGMAYRVLGDYFVARRQAKTALTAYLKVVLMYASATDNAERTHCAAQAATLLTKLGRGDLAAKLVARRIK